MTPPTRALRFVAALPEPLRDTTAADGALDAALAELLATARAAWPALAVDQDDFLDHVARRMPIDDTPRAVLPTLCAADLYLAHAALRGGSDAIRALHDGPLTEAAAAARRRGGDATLAEDIGQRVSMLLLVPGADGGRPKLEQYGGRGSVRAFVRIIAAREVQRVRSRDRERPTESVELFDAVMGGDDAELTYLKASYREVFRAAFEHAVRHDLSIHDRLLLRQHFLDGLTIDQVCALHRVHRTTAARWLGRVRDKLYRGTRRQVQEALAIAPAEFEELLRVIASQLDASIRRLLATSPSAV
jgi:RNA polymerase sigma-70 factor, ECF subfamily